jgi:hypothetical protein
MAIEQDFTDHAQVILLIDEVQESEQVQRDIVHEQKEFILEKDGQWDHDTVKMMDGRYRGTFDQVSPILDQITGEMDDAQFGIEVSPAGGDATEETAEMYAGLIRNIENTSNTKLLYSDVGKSMVMGGIDGCEIVQEHLNANTFDQDLIFKPVSDWYKSVWFDLAAIKEDMSDANWAIKTRKMPAANYDKQFPDGSGKSIGDNSLNDEEVDKTYDTVTVGKLYFKKPITIELVKLSDGKVMVKDGKFLKIQDELAAQQITVVDERERKSWRVWTRILDGAEWLGEEEETVFSYIPLVPAHGNYAILAGVRKYFGKTMKLMDSQRGLNFAISAEIEDVALAPTDAIWMTKEQAAGEDYSRMNIDRQPVRFYTHEENQMPPSRMGGKQGNVGLQTAAANFQGLLTKTANMDDASMGQNLGQQSGAALQTVVTQSNNGNVKWFKAMETFICQLYRVCVDAVPRVYDGARQQRILGEDGVGKMVQLNQKVYDEQSKQNVELNDLSKGSYDVTCSMGAAFKNQQEATVAALQAYAATDPAIMEVGRDIVIKNQDSPGMDLLAERFRIIGIQNGTIPREQYTEEEEQQAQQQEQAAAQQPPQEDPNMIIAQAEMSKAQAEQMNAQNKQAEIQGNQQLDGGKLQLAQSQLQLDAQKFQMSKEDKFNVDAANIQMNQSKVQMQQQKQQFEQMLAIQQQQAQEMNDSITNLKNLREAMGVDAIVGPGNQKAYVDQAQIVQENQDN